MRKGLHQVAKSASKVRKSATSGPIFGPSVLTFEAVGAIFRLP